ncbi:hemA, partial [Symbiodinium microadriaticum]
IGKLVRTRTKIGKGSVSVSSAAVELMMSRSMQDLRKPAGKVHVCIVGAGKMSRLCLLALFSKHPDIKVTLVNRSVDKAQAVLDDDLVKARGGTNATVASMDDMFEVMKESDVVFTATGSEVPIIHAPDVEGRERPLMLIDISVPLNVDAGCADVKGVFSYSVDDLQKVVQANAQKRQNEVEKARKFIGTEVGKFKVWQASQGAVPYLAALQEIARSTLPRTGCPTFRFRILRMGKSSWDTSPGYRYWRGAYGAAQAPWRPSGGAKNKEQRDAGAASFPAYDQRPAPKGKAKASRSDAPPGPPGGSAMVQRALNNTRKAEGRVQRLTEDRAQAEELWLKYLHDHKQAYLRERARHLKFLETSAREIEMAEQQQMEARASLRATVLEAATSQPTDQAMEVDPDWAPAPAPQVDLPMFRIRVFQGPRQPLQPLQLRHHLVRCRQDFASSPRSASTRGSEGAHHCGSTKGRFKPATSAPNQVVHPAQEGVSLADKLAMRRSALEPFGQARFPAPPGLAVPELSEAEIAIAEARARALQQQALNAAPGVHPALANASILSDDEGEGVYAMTRPETGVVRGMQGGMAGVIVDLTGVGGNYFATFLPRTMEYASLRDFVAPLVRDGLDNLFFFIGMRSRHWPPCAMVTLRDGDVILAATSAEPRSHLLHPEGLLQPVSTRNQLRHFFDVELHEATCVMFRDSRYTITSRDHPGQDVVSYFADSFRMHRANLLSCTFPTPDLDVHGLHCAEATTIFEVPAIREGDPAPERNDFFTLCDFRPLGSKPRVIISHVPLLHVPSLLSNLGIQLPAAYRADVVGGRVKDDYVKLRGNRTLIFFAKVVEDSTSTSSASSDRAQESNEAFERHSPSASRAPAPSEPAHADAPAPQGALPATSAAAPAAGSGEASASWGLGGGTFEGLALYDPSLPAGQSWNEAVTVLPQDLGNNTVASREQGTASWSYDLSGDGFESDSGRAATPPPSQPVMALVYTEDFTPEMHTVEISFPCGINRLLVAVNAVRDADLARHFPCLRPASPQLHREFVTLLAAPLWLTHKATVLLDTSRINGCVFAAALPMQISREALILAANLTGQEDIGVFVHGLLRPLEQGHSISLLTGMTVAFLPGGLGTPACHELSHMLSDAEGWDVNADLPGPRYAPWSHFYLLTDVMPRVFEVKPGRRPHFRRDVAEVVGSGRERLTLVAAKPRVLDLFIHGTIVSGVFAATEQLRATLPPLGQADTRVVLFVDCRRISAGFRWILHDAGHLPVASFTSRFRDRCPAGYQVLVHGLPLRDTPQGPVFELVNGSIAVVEFSTTNNPVRKPAPSSGPPPDPPPPRDDDDSQGDGGPRDGPGSTRGPSSRSRSPRSQPLPDNSAAQGHPSLGDPSAGASESAVGSPLPIAALDSDMIQPRPGVGDRVVSLRPLPRFVCPASTVLLQALVGALQPGFAASCSPSQIVTYRLLPSSFGTGGSADAAFESARIATRQLGLPWPLDNHLAPLPLAPDVDLDEAEEGQTADLFDVSFVILAPDYDPEVLTLTILLPQSQAEALEVVDTCRSQAAKDLFPVLCPIFPQPDPRLMFTSQVLRGQFRPAVSLAEMLGTPIANASLYGRHCKAVVAVGHSPRRDAEQRDVVGLLDCRPILEGWHRLPSDVGRVDLEMLRRMLDQAAPPGYHVHFTGCGRHWTWLWINRGQVVRVSYEPDSHPPTSATGTPTASDDNAQGPLEPDDNDVDTLGDSPAPGAGSETAAPSALGAGPAYQRFFAATIAAGVCGLTMCLHALKLCGAIY